jgi:hypothetical protein
MVGAGRVAAAPLDQGGTEPFAIRRSTHATYASADVRADAAPMIARSAMVVGESAGGGGALTINVTFDASITNDPNAAAIEAMINQAVGALESVFDDPIVVSIRFATRRPTPTARRRCRPACSPRARRGSTCSRGTRSSPA